MQRLLNDVASSARLYVILYLSTHCMAEPMTLPLGAIMDAALFLLPLVVGSQALGTRLCFPSGTQYSSFAGTQGEAWPALGMIGWGEGSLGAFV